MRRSLDDYERSAVRACDCLRRFAVKAVCDFFDRPRFADGGRLKKFLSSFAQALTIILCNRSIQSVAPWFVFEGVLIAKRSAGH